MLPRRKNNRLKEYDYSKAGYYFITICTKDNNNLFWNIGVSYNQQSEKLPLSNIGEIIDMEINNINSIYENVEIDKYVIMPNHVHMIIVLHEGNDQSKVIPTISRVIQQFKGSISKQVGFSLWQKSFYDNIIRKQEEYENIYEYIETNPLKWEEDKYYV